MKKIKLSSTAVAISLAAGAFMWVATGEISHSQSAENVVIEPSQIEVKQPLFNVQVKDFRAHQTQNLLRLQGQIETPRKLELKAEISGVVVSKMVTKGKSVSKGQALIQLEVSDRELALEHAKSELLVKQADMRASERLLKKKLVSLNKHKQTEAQLISALASVKQLELELQHTQIKAPFSGVLNELAAEQGSYVGIGDPVGVLVDDSYALIVAQVPQKHISQVNLGMPVSATLLDGIVLKGEVSYVSKSSDPQTRTYRIEARVDNIDTSTAFGQSAKIKVELSPIYAQKIPASILNLSTEGDLQVKGVDSHNMVVTYPVELVRSDESGVYVKGLPEKVMLITVGQDFVANGQHVEPVTIAAGDA